MIERNRLPELMVGNIGNEKLEFTVKASRSQPVKNSLVIIFSGGFMLAFMSIFVVAFLGPLFTGNEVHFTANDVPVVAGPGNMKPIVVPGLIIGLFVLVGLGIFGYGIYILFKKGGYFAGTPTRLVHYTNGTVRSIDWEQFSGDISVRGNDSKGSLTLGMRTGKMVSRKNGPDQYVPDTMYISGIQDVFTVEQICRSRIKENDPTPPAQ